MGWKDMRSKTLFFPLSLFPSLSPPAHAQDSSISVSATQGLPITEIPMHTHFWSFELFGKNTVGSGEVGR